MTTVPHCQRCGDPVPPRTGGDLCDPCWHDLLEKAESYGGSNRDVSLRFGALTRVYSEQTYRLRRDL